MNDSSQRRRILVLTSTFPRWQDDAEPAFVFDLCRRLAAEHDVSVLAPHTAGAERQEFFGGVKVMRYRYAPAAWEKLAYDGGILANLRRNWWLHLLLPVFFLTQFLAVIRSLRRLEPDAVHAHWIVPQGIILAAALPFCRKKPRSVCTAHGSDVLTLHGRIWPGLRRWVALRCDHIIAVSGPLRDRLLADGCPHNKIGVIPMGVDLAATFVPSEQARSRGEILFVGRLVRDKGADVLLRAMPAILERHSGVKLTMVGDGPEKTVLHNVAHSLGIDGQVYFAGALSNAKLPEYYRRAALLVQPSREEGFGLVVVEALGCGCPVVASDLPALRDLIVEGETGRFFRCNDAEDLARMVNDILCDPEGAKMMADQGRRFVLLRYDWKCAAHSYLEALLPALRD